MNLPSRSLSTLFVVLWIGYAIAATMLFASMQKPRGLDARVKRIGFHMDAIVANIARDGTYGAFDQDGLWFASHRMPVVPCALAGILSVSDQRHAAHSVKVLATTAPLWLALYLLACAPEASRRAAAGAVALVALSPQIAQQHFTLGTEEGWIMGPMALAGVLLAMPPGLGNDGRRALLVPLPALLYLTKSSLLPFAVVLAVATAVSLRGWKAIACCALLVAAIAGWGMHTRANGGGFRTGTSFDGWNLCKGNNPFTLSVYPGGTLDILDDREIIRPGVPCATEWEWDAAWRSQATRYIAEHPGATAAAALAKAWNLLVNPWNPPSKNTRVALAGAVAGAAWMLAFRVVFAVLVWRAMRIVVGAIRRREPLSGAWSTVAALLLLAALYAAPYLVGFAYERHALPLAMLCPGLMLAIGRYGGERSTSRAES